MNGLSVFFIALVTSVLGAAGTVYVIQRYQLLEPPIEEALVPDLRGLSEKDARTNLQSARLSLLVSGREPNAKVKPGTVLRQSVPPGQNLPLHHPVAVVFADEAPKVPNVAGLTPDEARQKLATLEMKLELGAPLAHESVPEGKIAVQTPAADGPYDPAHPIVVQVSSGATAVEVPKVVGLSVDKAKAELEKAGLVLAPVRWVSIAETATFVVLSQKPKAGEKLKPGAEVELSANR